MERCLRIEVRGIVQGVGLRPCIYRLAREHRLAGWVENTPEGALVVAAGSADELATFLEKITAEAPPAAVIEEVIAREVAREEVLPSADGGFRIRDSSQEGRKAALISPDLATCADCLREMHDPADRRYRYPFINCTNCGPRFTIIADIPYDRPLTTMAAFTMCPECEREYHDPADRRFHAQPNACPKCGPRLRLEDGRGNVLPGDPVVLAAEALRAGKTVAVKGLGGFQLACDATSDAAVSRLRERKRRYAKPLAVMAASLQEAERYCEVSEEERALLASPRAPIVLLRERDGSPLSRLVAPGLDRQGIFLPYTPLHHLLLEEAGIPLVMTSGNVSEEPIAKDNDEARSRLAGIADLFLVHDRDILVRYDDSVTSVLLGREYPLRRARGYAPYPVVVAREYGVEVLALGAELKNTFCFLRGRHAFLGQHIGDLDDLETLRHYEEAMAAVRRLFDLSPGLVAHDLHPDYMSTQLAADFALPRVAVQHHHAHVASCLADNGFSGRVIGVAWDGTGYGADGTVWGGEFLLCDEAEFTRAGHLHAFPMPGGEVCARELERMAFGVLWGTYGEEDAVMDIFSSRFAQGDGTGGFFGRGRMEGMGAGRDADPRGKAQALAAQVRSGINVPFTSSAGRLFDAVAALLGVRGVAYYEGQAACELEAVASSCPRSRMPGYEVRLAGGGLPWVLDTRPLVLAVLEDLEGGRDVSSIAAGFHAALARGIVETCLALRRETGIAVAALSGGVFQNRLLTAMAVEGLESEGFRCLLHRRVPCNDGGVSLGQAVAAASRSERGLPLGE
ncbi:MAG: carbamoyltransferase HypF [Actinobacteria bacterium]|nr:carbamoyltransferase HypF [Actinomycetota bacterium]